ncbi:MAG: hypothetical protein Phog2KO_19980 [Phototrophicaceae bacterium]
MMLILITMIGGFSSQPSQAQSDVAWTGLFFPSTDFTGTSQLVSYPAGLSVSWGLGAPTDPATSFTLVGIPADNFSARFSANANIPAGTYDFIVVADGGVRLTANNNVIIDALGNAGATTQTGTFTVTGGMTLLILDYVEFVGAALVQITWQASGLPEAEATTIPTNITEGEVFSVDGLALRSGPYLGASLVAVLRPGIRYTVTAQSNAEGAVTWYRVVLDPAGQTGWASGRFLNVDLRPNSSYTCSVSPELALSVAQQLNSTLNDANAALQCANSVISATDGFSQTDELTAQDIVDVGGSCVPVLGNSTVDAIVSLVDVVELGILASDACTENSTPTIFLPEESTVFETLASLPDTEAFAYPRAILNIRVRPSTRVATLGQIPWGAEAQLLARTVQAGDDHWYLIRYNGIVGWIDASFANVNGNMATVPIY